MGRFFPEISLLEMAVYLGGRVLLGLGLAFLLGAVIDRVGAMRAEPASDADFSMPAMRDRRIRKMNSFYLTRGAWFVGIGGALLAIDTLLR